ncbi:MAG: ribonuclease III, partial [Alphaproteobacteria bacterium]|nr:ribonuclease III [Alphaproteobacteria bacterium]
ALVRGESLARLARTLNLGPALVLGASEVESEGRERPTGLANAYEAVIAALYLDGGFAVAERFVLGQIESLIDEATPPPQDPKTALQEWAQARKRRRPAYQIVTISGEPHAPRFEVEVTIEGLAPIRAGGASKREAEQAAALVLLDIVTASDHG